MLTGGEPTLHPDLVDIVRHGAESGIKVLLVSNAGLLKPHKIHELIDAGLSSFIISIDAANVADHEDNRGLPGVCDRIREANRIFAERKIKSTASVTMSRLVDYDALPGFLASLGFSSVVFSYPLKYLPSFFLGYRDSHLVDYTAEELHAAYEKVKNLKNQFHVVNPLLSLEEMQRFVRKEEQHYECLAGFRYFFLDWQLMLWRCHHWEEPMCSIYEFDETKLVRDGCTRCMINCYRDFEPDAARRGIHARCLPGGPQGKHRRGRQGARPQGHRGFSSRRGRGIFLDQAVLSTTAPFPH